MHTLVRGKLLPATEAHFFKKRFVRKAGPSRWRSVGSARGFAAEPARKVCREFSIFALRVAVSRRSASVSTFKLTAALLGLGAFRGDVGLWGNA